MEKSGPPGPRRVASVGHSDEVSFGVLRGNHPARIDGKGRLKVPNSFRQLVEAQWGTELFVTSVSGDFVRVYPMGVWLEIERKLAEVPSTHPSKLRFLDRVNFFGQAVTMDRQGRVVVPQLLRESAKIEGEVVVMGQMTHLEVWNHDTFRTRLQASPLTDHDLQTLADLGI